MLDNDNDNFLVRNRTTNRVNSTMRKVVFDFELMSITSLFIMINVLVYILLVIYTEVTSIEFYCGLYRAGAANPYPVRENGQWYRLIVPIVLHANFSHIMYNTISLLLFGYQIERILKFSKYLALYLCSGIVGNIIGSSFTDSSILVGASTSIMGIVGFHFVHLIVQYNDPNQREYVRANATPMMINYFIMIMSSMLDTSGNKGVFGHMGGVLFGVAYALIYYSPTGARRYIY